MQLFLRFEEPLATNAAVVWATLDDEQRAGAMAALASLIAKVALADGNQDEADKEKNDE